jgi:hypothetical protein
MLETGFYKKNLGKKGKDKILQPCQTDPRGLWGPTAELVRDTHQCQLSRDWNKALS